MLSQINATLFTAERSRKLAGDNVPGNRRKSHRRGATAETEIHLKPIIDHANCRTTWQQGILAFVAQDSIAIKVICISIVSHPDLRQICLNGETAGIFNHGHQGFLATAAFYEPGLSNHPINAIIARRNFSERRVWSRTTEEDDCGAKYDQTGGFHQLFDAEKRYLSNRELSLLSRSKKCPVINAKEVAVENRAEETYYHRTI